MNVSYILLSSVQNNYISHRTPEFEILNNLPGRCQCPSIDSSKSTFTQQAFLTEVPGCSGKLAEGERWGLNISYFNISILHHLVSISGSLFLDLYSTSSMRIKINWRRTSLGNKKYFLYKWKSLIWGNYLPATVQTKNSLIQEHGSKLVKRWFNFTSYNI